MAVDLSAQYRWIVDLYGSDFRMKPRDTLVEFLGNEDFVIRTGTEENIQTIFTTWDNVRTLEKAGASYEGNNPKSFS